MFYYTIPCTVYYRYDATRTILHIRHSRITVHTILYCAVLHRTYFHYAYYTRHTALCILYIHSKQYGTRLCTKVTPYRIILCTLPCTHFAFNTVHSTLYIQHRHTILNISYFARYTLHTFPDCDVTTVHTMLYILRILDFTY